MIGGRRLCRFVKGPLLPVAKRGRPHVEHTRVVVTADRAVSLDCREATGPAEAELGVVWRALLHLVISLQHKGALVRTIHEVRSSHFCYQLLDFRENGALFQK